MRWANEHEPTITGSIDNLLKEQFPNDYCSRRLWRQKYIRERWEEVPDSIAAAVTQLPNRFRRKVCLKPRGPSSQYNLPTELEQGLSQQLEQLVSGECQIMPRSDHVAKKDLEITLAWLLDVLNKEVRTQSGEVQEHNQEALKAFADGSISQEELTMCCKTMPKEIKSKSMRHLVAKFCHRTHLTKQSCNTSGNYLPFDDIQMQQWLG